MNGYEIAALRARITTLEGERDALRAELAHEAMVSLTELARVERAYQSAAAQARSYRAQRDEGYAQGRADERAVCDLLAGKQPLQVADERVCCDPVGVELARRGGPWVVASR
jgi:hypothetical protein